MAKFNIWFFENQDVQARVDYEAAKQGKDYAKFVAEIVSKFIEQKFGTKNSAKNSRHFYFICQEYAKKMHLTIAAFIEHACTEMLGTPGERKGFWQRLSEAMDLNAPRQQ